MVSPQVALDGEGADYTRGGPGGARTACVQHIATTPAAPAMVYSRAKRPDGKSEIQIQSWQFSVGNTNQGHLPWFVIIVCSIGGTMTATALATERDLLCPHS